LNNFSYSIHDIFMEYCSLLSKLMSFDVMRFDVVCLLIYSATYCIIYPLCDYLIVFCFYCVYFVLMLFVYSIILDANLMCPFLFPRPWSIPYSETLQFNFHSYSHSFSFDYFSVWKFRFRLRFSVKFCWYHLSPNFRLKQIFTILWIVLLLAIRSQIDGWFCYIATVSTKISYFPSYSCLA